MKPIPVKRVRGRYNYKGVRLKKSGKWVAESRKQMGRNKIWLGTYNTEKEAALAHDAAIVCLRGASSFASLNFPDDLPILQIIPTASPIPRFSWRQRCMHLKIGTTPSFLFGSPGQTS
ncbi:ethylene-responsive transcription factor ERF017-like [Impatiens glandulifera]|uniref:ethylene-responsive transcription factor ERF017-like n=1 Tax=Impatiens glandulifera TaxID=253017 RepID=UPI001FB07CAC|nr:ethylene-responsive transcription factor ERF017-like [Impatiens glandulifera]